MLGEENNEVMKKAYNTILLGLGNEVLYYSIYNKIINYICLIYIYINYFVYARKAWVGFLNPKLFLKIKKSSKN